MQVRTNIRSIVTIVAVAMVLIAAGVFSTSKSWAPRDTQAVPIGGTVTIAIDGMGTTTATIDTESTVLSVLTDLDSTNEALKLGTTTYSGLGTLVTSMNGNTNGAGGRYWQYAVNGVMPLIGADQYVLAPNDIVTWTFAPSTY
jgi:hypothetical protein